jgi:hypothetical protein
MFAIHVVSFHASRHLCYIILTSILKLSGRNLAWRVKHLQRAPCANFQPVVVNPWTLEDVPSHRKNGPWIPGDRLQAIHINDDAAEDPVDAAEQAIIVDQDDQDDDAEEDFTNPDGEGTQLDGSPQDVEKDHDSTLTTQQSSDEQNAAVLLTTAAAGNAQVTTSPSVEDDDVAMEDASEQDDSVEDSDAHSNTELEKTTRATSPASEDAFDDGSRTNWCVCNGEDTGTSMILCDNAKDPICEGKWYHPTCVDMTRPPPKKMDWYCPDCRKKLKLGVYSNGCVTQGRKATK